MSEALRGRLLGRYRVGERLGAGGMGVVHLAHDTTLDREVVLKVLPEEAVGDAVARARLLDEARKAAGLAHPHLCTIHEAGEESGLVYIAMERIAGRTLEERLAAGALPVATALGLAIQIADAVAHAHDRGIVHRDLKSANVIVTPEGRAKVLDFGIARRVDPVSQATRGAATAPGAGGLTGTPHALPPEAFRGERADARGDVWALGVLLHEMLTGARPFAGATEYELGAAVLNSEPAPLPDTVPAAVRSIVRRCLAREPGERFQRASEVRAVLEMARAEAPGPPPAAAPPPAPRRPGRRAAIAVGAVVLVVAAVLGVQRLRGPQRAAPGAIRSLAVLPLQNLSADPAQEFFADGMTEELIASLANLEGVRVISRTSVMRYKGTDKRIPQIARELGVDAIVEGSALRDGDQVRITAQLVEGASDRHLWARSYRRDLAGVLALQAEVAGAIAAEVHAALSPRGRERVRHAPAVVPAAYEEYLRGRHQWNQRTTQSLRLAVAHFQRALALDSSYAAAWSGLADVHLVMSGYTTDPPRENYERARAAARRALTLDPQLARARATLAAVRYHLDRDWDGAQRDFEEALRLDPSDATLHQWYGLILSFRKRHAEAGGALARAQALDPLAPVRLLNLGQHHFWQGRLAEAEPVFARVVAEHPGFSAAYYWLGRTRQLRGRHTEAARAYFVGDSLEGFDFHLDPRVQARLVAGDERGYWRALVSWVEPRIAAGEGGWSSLLAVAHAALGERERALARLREALELRESQSLFHLRDPALDPLRDDPRLVALLREHGLEP